MPATIFRTATTRLLRRARWRLRHWLRERVAFRFARLLPRDVAMWAAVRVVAHATQGRWGSTVVPELRAMEALRRWDEPA